MEKLSFWVIKNGALCGFISAHNFIWPRDKLGVHCAVEYTELNQSRFVKVVNFVSLAISLYVFDCSKIFIVAVADETV